MKTADNLKGSPELWQTYKQLTGGVWLGLFYVPGIERASLNFLSRTPIVNTLADAYGYVRFLKIRPWYDWDQFNDRVTRHEKKRRMSYNALFESY